MPSFPLFFIYIQGLLTASSSGGGAGDQGRADLVKYIQSLNIQGATTPKDAALHNVFKDRGGIGLSPCDIELGKDMDGRYPMLISQAFPPGVVIPQGPYRNMNCKCTTAQWMICTIFVQPESEQHIAVKNKLHRTDSKNMLPFYEVPSMLNPRKAPILFSKECGMGCPMVFTEIEITDPDSCMNINICGSEEERYCPLIDRHLEIGDAVYILKEDEKKVLEGSTVQCVSLSGLREKAMSHRAMKIGGFEDPFGRGKKILRTIKEDYSQYILFDEQGLLDVCGRTPGYVSSRISRGTKVEIFGLDDVGSDMNGMKAVIRDYDPEMGRYEVRINVDGLPQLDAFGLKREHIRVLSQEEQAEPSSPASPYSPDVSTGPHSSSPISEEHMPPPIPEERIQKVFQGSHLNKFLVQLSLFFILLSTYCCFSLYFGSTDELKIAFVNCEP